jgi:hypothetical protein
MAGSEDRAQSSVVSVSLQNRLKKRGKRMPSWPGRRRRKRRGERKKSANVVGGKARVHLNHNTILLITKEFVALK